MTQVKTNRGIVGVGSIVIIRGKLAIVDDVRPDAPKNPIQYKSNTEHRGYICGPDEIQEVLGTVDIETWKQAKSKGPLAIAKRDGKEALFGALGGVKVGTPMEIDGQKGLELVTYEGWKESRPKYPVSFSRDGKQMKGTLDLVIRVTRNGKLVPIEKSGHQFISRSSV